MKHKLLAVALLCLAIDSASVHAASTNYWDIDDATPGAGGGDAPFGTWDTGTTANWTTDPTGASTATTWAANDFAVFSAGTNATNAFTVEIPTTVAAGGVTVEEGIITMGTGTLDFGAANGAFEIATNAVWSVSGAGSGFVAGTGGLTKSGAGVLALGGTMPFSRSSGALLTINAGTVDFSGDRALGAVPSAARANAVTINGGTLRLIGSSSATLDAKRGITIGSNGGTIDVTNTTSIGLSLPSAGSFTLNGGSTAVMTKTGAGRFTMNTTSDSYTGKYVILAGSVNIPGDGRLGKVPASPQADHITLNGSSASLRIAVTGSTTLNANRGITLGASGGALQQPGPGTLTYNGIISSTGTGTLKIDSNDSYGGGTRSGTVVLGGANTYTGGTTIYDTMTLKLGASGVIPDTSTVAFSGSYVPTLSLNGFDETIGSLSSSVAGTVSLGSRTLTLANGRHTFAGTITGTGNLVKNGTSTEAFTGANTYTGTTTVNGGTLRLGAPDALPNSPIVLTNLAMLNLSDSVSATITALSGSGNVISNAFQTLTVNGALTTGSVFNQYSCFSGVITNGSLYKSGTHAMALRGSNTFDGTLTFDNGTLSVGAGPDRLPPTTALSFNSPALFQLDAGSQTVSSLAGTGNLNLGGGTLTVNPGAYATFSGVIQNSELAGSSTARGHGLRGYYYDNIDMTNLKAVRDDATVNFTDLTSASQLPAEIYSGASGTNTVSARWLGQVLSTAAGTYKFTTACDDGRRLWVNGKVVIDGWISGSSTKSGTVDLAANTLYDIVLEWFNGTGGSSARLLWTPPGDTTTNVIPTDYLFLPGAGKLVKAGSGYQYLSAASTYTGGTVVTGGAGSVLQAQVDGALGGGNVAVDDGSTLQLDSVAAVGANADVLLSGTAPVVSLSFGGTANIRALSYNGGATYQPAGTYGPIGSGAAHEDARFTGFGLLNVTAAPSTTLLAASGGASVVYGSSVTLTATVTPWGVTGSVTFYDGANWLGSAALNGSGVAALSVSNLQVAASPHALTAVYSGDATHAPSTAGAVTKSITAATLTPNVVVANKVYDGTNTATLSSATTLAGILSSDTNYVRIAGTAVATFVDKNVGVGKTVNITGLALEGSLSSNYAISTTSASVTADITAKALTVTNLAGVSRVYDGTTNGTFTGTAGLSGIIGSEVVTLGGTPAASFADKSIGTNKAVTVNGYTLGGADAGNYSVTPPTLAANITPAPLSVIGLAANNKVYDGAASATLSGTAALSGVISPDVVILGGTPVATFTNKNAGVRGVTVIGYTLSGADNTNYTLAQPADLSANITAVPTACVLLSSANPSTVTSNVIFTATVIASPPTADFPAGSISFLTNGVTVSIANLVSNAPGVATATYSTALLPAGTYTVAAQYPGDLVNFDYQGSSASLQQVVQNVSSASAVTISNIVGTTLTYGGGSGSKFILRKSATATAPMNTWTYPGQTNTGTPGTFTIPVGTETKAFYRITSE